MSERAPVSSRGRVLVLHGPNLNLLGAREPEIYGRLTLAEIDAAIRAWGLSAGWDVDIVQSNHEGVLIDTMHAAREAVRFQVINAGAYTHTSVALHDAIRAVETPTIEVHLSNIHAREPFRRHSMIAPACVGVICGLGLQSYLAALDAGARLYGGDGA